MAGRSFEAQRVTLGKESPNEGLETTLARYPLGAPVTVFYNPAHPPEAVLERALPGLGRGVGCVLAGLAGGVLLLLGFSRLRRWPRAAFPTLGIRR